MTSIPLGNTSTTSPPSIVERLESETLCPCAVNAEAALVLSRFCKRLLAPSVPKSEEMAELMLEAR